MLIVLPKGRLLKEIRNLLELIGISFEDSSRKLVMDTSVISNKKKSFFVQGDLK